MKINIFISLLSISLVTGCLPNNNPPATIYTLSPQWNNSNTQTDQLTKFPLIIKLSPVRATRSLTGTEILYTDSEHRWNSYVNSHWNDTPIKLLQTLIQVSIETSNLFKAVVPSTSVSTADFLLESTLLDLSHHINEDGTAEGIIRIRFYLIDNSKRMVLASREFVSQVPVSRLNAKAAVEALNIAATSVTYDLISWLSEYDRFK
ncbi:MAG: ABC-type transport auxiliary lipoprotein family protein [Methylococcaceae bacterium]